MKKYFFKFTIIAIFGLVVGYTAYNSQKSDINLSDIVLENVEALASESSSGCHPTWCDKKCKKGSITYTYQSSSKCSCSLCN